MWNRYKIDELLCGIEPRTIIDIGANIGEFSYYTDKKYLEELKYLLLIQIQLPSNVSKII